MKKYLLFTIFFAIVGNLFSQVTIEDEVTTDSVNLFSPSTSSQTKAKSNSIALFSTIVLPGMGHNYLDIKPRASLAYFSFDLLAVCGAIFTEVYSRDLDRSSKAYACLNATISNVNSAPELYWAALGQYMDYNGFERDFRASRDPENEIWHAENLQWQWSSEESQKEYNEIRKSSRRFHILSSFCIGALILNRVVSFIDLRASTRYKSFQGFSNASLSPTVGKSSLGLQLNTSF